MRHFAIRHVERKPQGDHLQHRGESNRNGTRYAQRRNVFQTTKEVVLRFKSSNTYAKKVEDTLKE